MKTLHTILYFLVFLAVSALNLAAQQYPSMTRGGEPDSPALNEAERALPLTAVPVSWTKDGSAVWKIDGTEVTLTDLAGLTPWQTLQLVQKLSGHELALSRFGDVGSQLLRAWIAKLQAYLAAASKPSLVEKAQLFDPAVSVWDPGLIQQRNSLGQWYIQLFRRNIIESDIASLSPLEVAQAVRVLTGHRYSNLFILTHLAIFRAQLRIENRIEAVATSQR